AEAPETGSNAAMCDESLADNVTPAEASHVEVEAHAGQSNDEDDIQTSEHCGAKQSDRPESLSVQRVARAPYAVGYPSDVLYDPARFYEPDYRGELRRLAASIIDGEGPITFKRLSDRIARAHGFQR